MPISTWKSSTTTNQDLDQIVHFIRHNDRFAVTGHSSPDGDSLGSSLALALMLLQCGKQVSIINSDPHPQAYAALPGIDLVQVAPTIGTPISGIFVLECSDLERPGLQNLEQHFTINIDHHPNTTNFGDLNWIDTQAAAVGEMIFDLGNVLEIELNKEIATNLYVALMTDTGSFQFANTTERTFEIASRLVAAGANPAKISNFVYMQQPASKLRMLAKVLDTLEIDDSGRIAWVHLTQSILNATGANLTETEGIVNYPLSIEGVVLSAFFREETDSSYRISLRSTGDYDVGLLARDFGGGGHRNASGLSSSGPFEKIKEKILAQLRQLLSR